MDFGEAIKALKKGERVSRQGWNGKGMFIYLVTDTLQPPEGLLLKKWSSTFIVMKTADDQLIPWLASQTDVLAEDWGIVEY